MKAIEVVVLDAPAADAAREYYCQGCHQLRLWLRDGLPVACGACGGSSLTVGKVGELDPAKLASGAAQ